MRIGREGAKSKEKRLSGQILGGVVRLVDKGEEAKKQKVKKGKLVGEKSPRRMLKRAHGREYLKE